MSVVPRVPQVLEYLNTADLRETFEFKVDGVERDFTGSTIAGALKTRTKGASDKHPLSTADGSLLVVGHEVTVVVERSGDPAVLPLPPGLYDMDLVETRADGVDDPLMAAVVKITKGAQA